jgi:DNA polymerase-4
MPSLCRDCCLVADAPPTSQFADALPTSQFADALPGRCPSCGGGRLLRHRSLATLTVAHIDCDAFYASVEKRDRP